MMDISLSQRADNSVYYLYLADPGQRIKPDDTKTQERSLGLIRFPLSPVRPPRLYTFQSQTEIRKKPVLSPLLLSVPRCEERLLPHCPLSPSGNLTMRIRAQVSMLRSGLSLHELHKWHTIEIGVTPSVA